MEKSCGKTIHKVGESGDAHEDISPLISGNPPPERIRAIRGGNDSHHPRQHIDACHGVGYVMSNSSH